MSSIFIDFRDSAGFVTDPSGATYATVADAYPVTRGGVTFGWTFEPSGTADRDAGNIAQLAGIAYKDNTDGTPAGFQLDVAALGGAGTYKIGMALGDAVAGGQLHHALVKDGGTTLFTVTGTTSAGDRFLDATGVELTNTSWLAGQAYQTVTVAGTSLLVVAGNAASGFTQLACLYVEFVPTATALPTLFHKFQTFPRRRGR